MKRLTADEWVALCEAGTCPLCGADRNREIADVFMSSYPLGECFSYAYQFVTRRGGVLKHGTVTHPWDKNKFPHAWVEKDGKIYDWQTTEVRKADPLPEAAFKKLWKPRNVRSYTADEARARALRTKHYGPWEKG